jgi:hypothetical protein
LELRDFLRLEGLQLLFGKPKQVNVEILGPQLLDLKLQDFLVPPSIQRELVVGDNESATLRLLQVIEHDDGDFLQPELTSSGQATVPSNDDAITADKDRVRKPERLYRSSDLRDLFFGVGPRIFDVWNELV